MNEQTDNVTVSPLLQDHTEYTLTWGDVHYTVKTPSGTTKEILKGVSGYVEPGTVRTFN